MELLLDTHSLLWYTESSERLSLKAKSLLESPLNNLYVSTVSFYEIAIKVNIGKLKLGKTIHAFYKQTLEAKIKIINIDEVHLAQYTSLPQYTQHKDPFDRLIIATAMAHNFTLVSADKNFNLYNDLVEIVF